MKDKEIVRVRDVMRQEIDIIDGMTTINDALKQMKSLKNKMLIVDSTCNRALQKSRALSNSYVAAKL